MIDTFSKFMTVVPLKLKQANEVLEAIRKGIQQMGKKLGVIYSDDEGSFNSKQAQEFYENEKYHPHDHQSSRTSRGESSSNDQEHALQTDGSQAG